MQKKAPKSYKLLILVKQKKRELSKIHMKDIYEC